MSTKAPMIGAPRPRQHASRLALAVVTMMMSLVGAIVAPSLSVAKDATALAAVNMVPQQNLDELAAHYVPPNAALTDPAKLRRYELVLSKGRLLERQYPRAINLYQVHDLMLAAAQSAAGIGGSDEARAVMLDLAARIADSAAPATSRLPAHLLLTYAQIARHRPGDPAIAIAIARLADQYYQTPVEAQAAMRAMMMAFDAGHAALFAALRDRLANHFGDDLQVRAFLLTRYGVLAGQSMVRGQIELADGRGLRLPMDTLGRNVALVFWSADTEQLELKMGDVKDLYRAGQGILLVGVNIDPAVKHAQRTAERLGLDFPQAFRARGLEDPLLLSFARADLPSICYIDAAGKGLTDKLRRHKGFDTDPFDNDALVQTMVFLRAGEFMITRPVGVTQVTTAAPPELGEPEAAAAALAGLAGPRVPAAVLGAIQECFAAPPRRLWLSDEQAAARYSKAVALCEAALDQHGKAADLFLVRNRLMAALVGLAAIKTDAALLERAAGIAQEVLDSDAPPRAKLLADLCATRWALRQADDHAKAGDGIAALLARHGDGQERAPALIASVVLSMELGLPELGRDYLGMLAREHRQTPAARVVLRQLRGDNEEGLTFRAKLTLLDGSTLSLPDDWRGQYGLVYIVRMPENLSDDTARRKHSLSKLANLLKPKYGPGQPGALPVVAVLIGGTQQDARAMADQWNWPWPIAFSGMGLEDPVAQIYGDPGFDRGGIALTLDRSGKIIRQDTGAIVHRRVQKTLAAVADRIQNERDIAAAEAALHARNFKEAEQHLATMIQRSERQQQDPHVCFLMAQTSAGLEQWPAALHWLNESAQRADKDRDGAIVEQTQKLRAVYEAKAVQAAALAPEAPAEQGVLPWDQAMPGARLVQQWMIVGPFGLQQVDPERSHYLQIVLTESGLAQMSWKQALPPEQLVDFEATYPAMDGEQARWQPITADERGYVSVSTLFPRPHAAAVAVSYVHCDKAGDHDVGIGSDDHHLLRVNGAVVHSHYGARGAAPAQDRVTISLEAGWNELQLKVGNSAGTWGYYFQIADPNGLLRLASRLPQGAKPVPRRDPEPANAAEDDNVTND
ncbi:MAG: hypothetical protein WD042_09655 [Phycisphaeraceae bacterium]